MLRPNRLSLAPPHDVAAAITSFTRPADVDAVFVGGRLRKWDGTLLGHDLARLREQGAASRDRLTAAVAVGAS
jgi:cytosine/adenosine deaminase-related metal-dependent hydrolase